MILGVCLVSNLVFCHPSPMGPANKSPITPNDVMCGRYSADSVIRSQVTNRLTSEVASGIGGIWFALLTSHEESLQIGGPE